MLPDYHPYNNLARYVSIISPDFLIWGGREADPKKVLTKVEFKPNKTMIHLSSLHSTSSHIRNSMAIWTQVSLFLECFSNSGSQPKQVRRGLRPCLRWASRMYFSWHPQVVEDMHLLPALGTLDVPCQETQAGFPSLAFLLFASLFIRYFRSN